MEEQMNDSSLENTDNTPAGQSSGTPSRPAGQPPAPQGRSSGRGVRPDSRGGAPGGERRPRRGGPGGPGGSGGPGSAAFGEEDRNEWKEKVIQIRRVTKVVKGGKKLSFRAVVVVGNGTGQVGMGIGKSNEVIGAIQKGIAEAKKNLVNVPLHKTTIPHHVTAKFGGSAVMLRPASEGTGVIAGGAARALLELAGIGDILSKSQGSNSPLNVARATLKGLSELRTYETIARNRGKSVKEILF